MKLSTSSVANKSMFSKSPGFKAVLKNEVGALYWVTFTNQRDNKDGRKANERFLFKINGYMACSRGGKLMDSLKRVESGSSLVLGWYSYLGMGSPCSAKEGDHHNTALRTVLTLSFHGPSVVGVMMACRHLALPSILTCVIFVSCVLSLFFLDEN